jgi:hypothetical protein
LLLFCGENKCITQLLIGWMKKSGSKTAKPKGNPERPMMLRENAITFSLNDPEYKALQNYCSKYKIKNRSRFLRESVMKIVLSRLTEDYPTLFGENEMR